MTEEQAQQPQQVFDIQKIYLKDVSFESPQSPKVFTEEFNLSTNVELNTASRKLGDNVFEVVLNITVTVKQGEGDDAEVAYLVEVKQAGVFVAAGFEAEQLSHILGSHCPNSLFPFAREAISDLVNKGGFPQMLLSPINFDALYFQHMQQQAQGEQEGDSATAH